MRHMERENTRVVNKVVSRNLPVVLTEMEREDYAKQLALEMAQYDVIENEKKSVTKTLGDKLKEKRELLTTVSKKVNTGLEDRAVECSETFDYNQRKVETIRNDTYELIEQRPMTKGEYQAWLQTNMLEPEPEIHEMFGCRSFPASAHRGEVGGGTASPYRN